MKTGYIYAFTCTFFASLFIVIIKWVSKFLPVLSILFLSLGAAFVVLSIIVLTGNSRTRLKQLSLTDWGWIILVVCLTFFGYWALFTAISLLDPTVASFLGRTETLITILFGIVLLGERFTRREITAIIVVFTGVLVIRYSGGFVLSKGIAYCLTGALLWGIAEGIAKIAVRSVTPLVFAWGRCLFLFPAFFIAAAISSRGIVLPDSTLLWAAVLGLGVAGPVMGRILYMKSLMYLPVSKVAVINQFQPVWVALLASIFLHTLPSLREWIGGILIITGCMLLAGKKRNVTSA